MYFGNAHDCAEAASRLAGCSGFRIRRQILHQGFLPTKRNSGSFQIHLRAKRLPPAVESTLFRVLQEALTNVQRHAQTKSVGITIHYRTQDVTRAVGDRGRGIPARQLSSFDLRDDSGGLGLIIMRERVDEAGGQLQIRTNRKGTELVATLPIPIPDRTPRS